MQLNPSFNRATIQLSPCHYLFVSLFVVHFSCRRKFLRPSHLQFSSPVVIVYWVLQFLFKYVVLLVFLPQQVWSSLTVSDFCALQSTTQVFSFIRATFVNALKLDLKAGLVNRPDFVILWAEFSVVTIIDFDSSLLFEFLAERITIMLEVWPSDSFDFVTYLLTIPVNLAVLLRVMDLQGKQTG